MKIGYSRSVRKKLKKLDNSIKARIFSYMDEVGELSDPRSRGKALTANLSGLWRYRVGKYRLVCKIVDSELVILVVDIAHRKEIYDK